MQTAIPPELDDWFTGRGWRVRRHQAEMLAASDAGRHALLVADTGAGKTLAGFLPTLADFTPSRLGDAPPPEGLHTLYVSPLKALAHDVQRNLLTPIDEIGLPVRVDVEQAGVAVEEPRRDFLPQDVAHRAVDGRHVDEPLLERLRQLRVRSRVLEVLPPAR